MLSKRAVTLHLYTWRAHTLMAVTSIDKNQSTVGNNTRYKMNNIAYNVGATSVADPVFGGFFFFIVPGN